MTDPSLMRGDGWVRCCVCGERHDHPYSGLHEDSMGLHGVCKGICAVDAGLVPAPFAKARPGQRALTYKMADGELIAGDYSFVTELEWFDDRCGEIRLIEQTWELRSEREVVLPDPIQPEDD